MIPWLEAATKPPPERSPGRIIAAISRAESTPHRRCRSQLAAGSREAARSIAAVRRLGRQLVLAHQLDRTQRGQPFGAHQLLGFALRCERYEDGTRPRRQDIERRVVPCLADRHAAASQEANEIITKSLDDYALGKIGAECGEIRIGKVGAGEETPRQVRQAPGAARRERCVEEGMAGRSPAGGNHDLTASGNRRGARRRGRRADIAGVDQPVGDLGRGRKASIEGNQRAVAMHQHRVEVAVHGGDDFVVPLRVVAHDDDVAHRAEEQRPRPYRAHRRDQRVQFETKGAARKREALDDYGIRPSRWQRPRGALRAALRAARRRSAGRRRRPARSGRHAPEPGSAARSRIDGFLGRWTGAPPLTSVTAMPSCTSASAIRKVRCKCPIPSRCWT